ncbi:hypothetical protein [Deinococcus sp. QL22]|uniref:hypothetical protein n=1 Tax=Deinococcus sp. QL22 TaxID=2939437 RepID=UPI00201832F8|nr:hypothetical protein [Deinococcus sp. QL22]UQN08804.1 hypothetical protein M1R55_19550 [Deinococcus sp. QL22]
MHVWVALPPALIHRVQTSSVPLGIRGFGIVSLYRREDDTLAYGLSLVRDLETQDPVSLSWAVVAGTAGPVLQGEVTPQVRLRLEADQIEYQAWMDFFRPNVSAVHRKIVTYRQRSGDPHYPAYRQVVTATFETLQAGQLPEAVRMNTVYYLMGQWRADQVPRHLRETYP